MIIILMNICPEEHFKINVCVFRQITNSSACHDIVPYFLLFMVLMVLSTTSVLVLVLRLRT